MFPLRMLATVAFLATTILSNLNADQTTPKRPNVVLILVDDMGWSDIGCYGSEIETPNIDRLASEGMLFTQFYNNAKCTTTDAFTDHAIRTVQSHVASGKPFFHYLPYTAPHYPLHAKPSDIAKYQGKYAEGWDVLRQKRLARQQELGLVDEEWDVIDRDDRAQPWESAKQIDEPWQQLRMEVYAAMIDSVDQNIGRLLDALDELEVADSTLVLFLADNGGGAETPGGNDPKQIPGPKEYYSHVGPGWATASNTPFRRYKQYCHEGGIATPLVARWPETIQPGSRSEQVCHIIDFLPTFLEMADADYPDKHPAFGGETIALDGKTMLPVFNGQMRAGHDYLFWHWSSNRAVRKGDWKLVWDKHAKTWELYDLAIDRTEAHDVASEHPELAAELIEKWSVWAKKTDVKVKK